MTILIGGHRGLGATDNATALKWRDAKHLPPENTIESFVGAFEAGADFIEFDVVPAKDGLVVMHSAKLEDHIFPPPQAALYTAELSIDALAQLKVGHRQAAKDRIPTLEAVLQVVSPYMTRGRFLNIEVKGLQSTGQDFSAEGRWGFISLILQTVQAAGLLDRVLFSSFQPSALHSLRAMHPTAKVGQLFTAKPEAGYLGYTQETVDRTLATLPGAGLHPPLQSFMEPTAPPPILPDAVPVTLWALREEPVAAFLPHWQNAIARLHDSRRQLDIITDYPAELRAALQM